MSVCPGFDHSQLAKMKARESIEFKETKAEVGLHELLGILEKRYAVKLQGQAGILAIAARVLAAVEDI